MMVRMQVTETSSTDCSLALAASHWLPGHPRRAWQCGGSILKSPVPSSLGVLPLEAKNLHQAAGRILPVA